MAVHASVAITVAFAFTVYVAAFESVQADGHDGLAWRSISVWLGRMLPGRMGLYLLLYGAILATVTAVESYRRLRQREVRGVELETMLATARLETLQTQFASPFLSSIRCIALRRLSRTTRKQPRP